MMVFGKVVDTGVNLNNVDGNTGYDYYYGMLKEYPILTAEEEHELAVKLVKNKDSVAREKLINSNLRLVISQAKKHGFKFSLSREDLIQVGNEGLIKAVDSFDPYRGTRFSTYAVTYIYGEFTRNDAKNRKIRIPEYLYQIRGRINKISPILREELKREPTPEEIAKTIGTTVKRVKTALNAPACYSYNVPDFNNKEKEEYNIKEKINQIRDDKDIENDIVNKMVSDNLKIILTNIINNSFSDIEKIYCKLKYYEKLKKNSIIEVLNLDEYKCAQLDKKIKDTFKIELEKKGINNNIFNS
ncbi:MAG: sigma-70 family RNA polymerase sigma factor [archaeon]